MAKDSGKSEGASRPEISVLVREELRQRGLSEAEIEATLRKKKRHKAVALSALEQRGHLIDPPRQKPPEFEIVTVEFAAAQLQLHPKTVLRFIKEGQLPAKRVGKSYRIVRADLDAFAGVPPRAETPAPEAWVTSIVDVPACPPDLAERLARLAPAALKDRPAGAAPMRADVIYEPDRPHLKIVLSGPPGDTASLLGLIRIWLEQR